MNQKPGPVALILSAIFIRFLPPPCRRAVLTRLNWTQMGLYIVEAISGHHRRPCVDDEAMMAGVTVRTVQNRENPDYGQSKRGRARKR